MPNNTSSIPIAKVIQGVRKELSDAIAEGDGKDLRFKLGAVELEFQVEVSGGVKGEVSAEGGIQIGVISIGKLSGKGEGERSRSNTHTIKLTLNPVTLDPVTSQEQDVLVNNSDIPDEIE